MPASASSMMQYCNSHIIMSYHTSHRHHTARHAASSLARCHIHPHPHHFTCHHLPATSVLATAAAAPTQPSYFITCTPCANKSTPLARAKIHRFAVLTQKQAAQFLASGWGTRVLSHDDSSGSMRMVQLPQVGPSCGKILRVNGFISMFAALRSHCGAC